MTFRGPFHLYAMKGRAERLFCFDDIEKARDQRRECWAQGWDAALFRVWQDEQGREIEEEV